MIRTLKKRAGIVFATALSGIGFTFPLDAQQSKSIMCTGNYGQNWNNCVGKLTDTNGNVYVGEFKNGKFEGKGTHSLITGQFGSD
ncbi:MAG: hypothetical protein EB015_21130 [Methylocystaceae bacterium]|nr:hypothetical protein [Methylocystaceae bacterium]